jgi:hypothetical protein
VTTTAGISISVFVQRGPTEQTAGTSVKQPNTFSSLALNGLNKSQLAGKWRELGGRPRASTCRHVATATLIDMCNNTTYWRRTAPAVANFEELLELVEEEITREKEHEKEKPREKVEEEIS